MVTRALQKYLRIAPKKLVPLARLLGKKKVEEALYLLVSTNKKGALILKKVIDSAVSNAKRISEKNLTEADLYISKITVNSGPALKRHRAMSMGRAGLIRKRTSHVLVELDALKKPSTETTTQKKAANPKRKLFKTGKK